MTATQHPVGLVRIVIKFYSADTNRDEILTVLILMQIGQPGMEVEAEKVCDVLALAE